MDPFHGLSPSQLRKSMFVLFCATLGSFLAIAATNQPLQNDVASLGILSLQFAGGLSTATEIVDSWGGIEQVYAGFNLGLDYLYLMAYSLFLGLACSGLARAWREARPWFAAVGFWLAWAMFGAAVLDMVENYALLRLLLGSGSARWPALATACASLKFGIVLTSLVYIAVGLLARLVRWCR